MVLYISFCRALPNASWCWSPRTSGLQALITPTLISWFWRHHLNKLHPASAHPGITHRAGMGKGQNWRLVTLKLWLEYGWADGKPYFPHPMVVCIGHLKNGNLTNKLFPREAVRQVCFTLLLRIYTLREFCHFCRLFVLGLSISVCSFFPYPLTIHSPLPREKPGCVCESNFLIKG